MAVVTFLNILEDNKVYNSSANSIQAVVLECKKVATKNPSFTPAEIADAVAKVLKVKNRVCLTSDDVNNSAAVVYANGRFIAFLPSGDGENTPLKPLYFLANGSKTKDGKNVYVFKRVHQRRKANKWVRPACNAVRRCYDTDTGKFVGSDRTSLMEVATSSAGSSNWGMQSAASSDASNYDWD